jgi:hypothetical protein
MPQSVSDCQEIFSGRSRDFSGARLEVFITIRTQMVDMWVQIKVARSSLQYPCFRPFSTGNA